MKRYLGIVGITVGGLFLASLLATPSMAAFDKDQQKCRKTLAKTMGKLALTADKEMAKCHKLKAKGAVSGGADCNDLNDPEIDSKIEDAITKAMIKVNKLCTLPANQAVLDEYTSCAADPCTRGTGVSTNPLGDFEEVVNCMACVAETSTGARINAIIGNGSGELSKEDAKCQGAFTKNYGKYVKTQQKTAAKCQGGADKIDDPDVDLHCRVSARPCTMDSDCDEFLTGDQCIGCVDDDAKGKNEKIRQKAEEKLTDSCTNTEILSLNICSGSAIDVPSAITCAEDESNTQSDEIILASYEFGATACPVGVVSTVLAKTGVSRLKHCSNQTDRPICTKDKDCKCTVGIEDPTCSSEVTDGACDEIQLTSRAFLDVGHNGLGHSQDLPDLYAIPAKIGCGACTAPPVNVDNPCGQDSDCDDVGGDGVCATTSVEPCGNSNGDCLIQGIDTTSTEGSYYLRCRTNPTIPCTVPFGSDIASCGPVDSGFCVYYLSGPAALSAANSPVCVWNRLDLDVSGTADPSEGIGQFTSLVRSLVRLGLSQTQPCPLCVRSCTKGDVGAPCQSDGECATTPRTCTAPPISEGQVCTNNPDCDDAGGDGVCGPGNGVCSADEDIPNDGIQGGTCLGGTEDGFACDVHSLDQTFGPTSLDCFLEPGTTTGAPLDINIDLTTGVETLPFGTDCTPPNASEACACAVCSGNTGVACNDNADCAAIAAGVCSAEGSFGAPRLPNGCTGFNCTQIDVEGNLGLCLADFDMFCDGKVRANGEGFLFCGDNTDCAVLDSDCPEGDCGNCTIIQNKKCFLDPIRTEGVPGTDYTVISGPFCIPPTSNNAVNLASGTPGPARVALDLKNEFRY